MDELLHNIDYRLKVAGLLNELLKSEKSFVKLPKTADEAISHLVDAFLRKHVENLLKEVMGEPRLNSSFNDEELLILRTVAAKIKSTQQGEQHAR